MRFLITVALVVGFTFSSRSQAPKLTIQTGHNDGITCFEISSDGRYLATSGYDALLKLWDFRLKKEVFTFPITNSIIDCMSFSDAGDLLATGGWDGEVKIFSVMEGKQVASYKHYKGVKSIAFSPDGRHMASVSYDSSLVIYSVKKDSIIRGIYLSGVGQKVKFARDGSGVFFTDDDTTEGFNGLYFFDLAKGEIDWDRSVNYIHGNIIDFDISFSGKLSYIITETDSGHIRIRSAENSISKDIARFNGHTKTPKAIRAGSEDFIFFTSEILKVGNLNETKIEIKKWDGRSQICIDSTVFSGKVASINIIAYCKSTKEVVISTSTNSLGICTSEPLQFQKSLTSITSLIGNIYKITGNQWLTTNYKGEISLLSIAGTVKQNILYRNGINLPILSKLSKDTQHIYFCNFNTSKGIKRLSLIDKSISDVFTTDTIINDFILNSSNDLLAYQYGKAHFMRDQRSVGIYDLKQNRKIADSVFNIGFISFLIFRDDSKELIIGHNQSDTIFLWNFETRQTRFLIDSSIRAFPLSGILYKGDKLITSCKDRAGIFIWDLNSLKLIKHVEMNKTEPWLSSLDEKINQLLVYYDDGSFKGLDATTFREQFAFPEMSSGSKMIGYTHSEGEVYSYYNNTFCVWKLEDQELHYRFIPLDSSDFILLNKEGYYYASQKGAKNLHYVLGKYSVITFEQLDVKYNRPDKILFAIGNTDTALIQSYKNAYQKRLKRLGIDTTYFSDGYSVPEAEFENRDKIEYEMKNEKLTLKVIAKDSSYLLDHFNIWINEVPLFGMKGINIRNRNSNTFDTTIAIRLSQGENRIETSVTNVNGIESYRMPLYVKYTATKPVKETVHFIGIGINEFADSKRNLQWCVKDIRDMALKFKEKYGDAILIDTLFDKAVTLKNVRALKQKLRKTDINDKVIIAYSGHGLLSKQYDYYLSAYNVNFRNPEENGIAYEEIEHLLDSIPARKKLLLLDACHSGEVDKDEMQAIRQAKSKTGNKGLIMNRGSNDEGETEGKTKTVGLQNSFELMQSLFVNVGKGTGATIISAAGGVQFAQERDDLENGVFTFSLLEVLNQYKSIKVSQLKKIVGERVEQLTNGLQKPTTRNELKDFDWDVW